MAKRHARCTHCKSLKTYKRGSRRGIKRYSCRDCKKSFSINHKQKQGALWHHFIDSSSLRKIGRDTEKSYKQIDNIIRKELDALPENGFITSIHTKHLSYRGVLCMDAKYVKVVGYEKKIPFLYVIDYHTHDIVCGFLCLSESRDSFSLMFRMLREMNYPLKYLVIDDVIEKLKYPLFYYFPRAKIQLCTTHFVRNARDFCKNAHIESRRNYDPFIKDLSVFLKRRTTIKNKEKSIKWLLQNYGADEYLEALLRLVIEKKEYLFLYCKGNEDIPHTNNLIEVFNSHLEGRLKTIKGFRSFHSAERFLNGWMVRRRTKEFSDCVKKFSHLNGKTSLGYALQDDEILKKICKDIYG